jgi:hypothetical protein
MSNSEFELPARGKKIVKSSEASMGKAEVEALLAKSEGTDGGPVEGGDKDKPIYSQDELLRVFDEIIFSGEYRETYNIKGKVPVTFKTRTAGEIEEIQHAVDSAGAQLISTVESIRSIMNLQFSLCVYRGKDLTMLKAEDRVAFIKSLSAPIVGMLLMTLSKFDTKVSMACREGEENF